MAKFDSARAHKIPTARNLENVALYYLSRYAASEFSLRRVLENRIRRAARRNPQFAGDETAQRQLRDAIKAIIEKHKKTGALNDAAYAEMKTASFRRAGRSARAIKQRLGKSGIALRVIEGTLEKSNEEQGREETEIKAALILARRRKLGPFRTKPADPEQRRKDLAILARAGFSFDIARKVLGMTVDEFEQIEAGS
jgi:regulatory protein